MNYRVNLGTEKPMQGWWTKRVMQYFTWSVREFPFDTDSIFTRRSLCVVYFVEHRQSSQRLFTRHDQGLLQSTAGFLFLLTFAASCAGFWCQILSWKGRSLADGVWSLFEKSFPVQVPLLQGLSSRELDCVADMWGPWHSSIWTCNMLAGPAVRPRVMTVMRCSVKSYATGEMPSHASNERCSYLEPSSPVTPLQIVLTVTMAIATPVSLKEFDLSGWTMPFLSKLDSWKG